MTEPEAMSESDKLKQENEELKQQLQLRWKKELAQENKELRQLVQENEELKQLRQENEELRNTVKWLRQENEESRNQSAITDFESEENPQLKRRRKDKSPVAPSDLFIDISNVIHEGSRELDLESGFNIDLQRLVTTVLNGKKLGEVFIVGSTPPPNVEFWKRAEDNGFIVNVFPRNSSNKEKKVDAQLICHMMRTIYTMKLGKLLLVSGDSDYSIPLKEAEEMKWEVEIWFWPKGMSNDFRRLPHSSLSPHHKSFVYVVGPDSTKSKCTLEISGEIIKSWGWNIEPIMECFCSFKLLCHLHWVNDKTALLYFDNEKELKSAKNWLSNKYPNKLNMNMLVKKQERNGNVRKNPHRHPCNNHSQPQNTDAEHMLLGRNSFN